MTGLFIVLFPVPLSGTELVLGAVNYPPPFTATNSLAGAISVDPGIATAVD